jgi:hypothetical protein
MMIVYAPNPLIVAADEERELIDQLTLYYGTTPLVAVRAATGDLQEAYRQTQAATERLSGIHQSAAVRSLLTR